MAPTYLDVADRIATRILSGDLPVGARLAPQRRFAYEAGVAPSTASRVYEELRRRGLVAGEVGRGTFVVNRFAPLDPAAQEPAAAGLDLGIVFRLGPATREAITASTTGFFRDGPRHEAFAPPSVAGPPEARAAIASLSGGDIHPTGSTSLLLAGSGKQALAAALSALAPTGGRVGVEALTYPFFIAAARRLGVELVPLDLDDEGVTPDGLTAAARKGLDAVYLQPTLQSPLVLSMSEARRRAVAEALTANELIAIEDAVYAFLRPATPLAALAPDRVVRVDSLSKRLMPGLSVGWLSAPPHLRTPIASAIRAGGWMAPSLSVALAQRWIDDGVVREAEAAKRREAAAMHGIAARAFAGLDFRGGPDALHGWIDLPGGWRGESFAAAAAALGIAVTPGGAFAVTPGHAPAGVRIAVSAPDETTWRHATHELARIALAGPHAQPLSRSDAANTVAPDKEDGP